MSYVLDGVPTAMEKRTSRIDQLGGAYSTAPYITCPCGWEASMHPLVGDNSMPCLRFHYTHCPRAKPPAPPCEHHRRRRLLGPGDCFTCLDCGTTIG